MSKVSIIIPSRNELFLNKTINDVFAKASGDIEVIAVLEGYWPTEFPKARNNLIYLHHGQPMGLRQAVNNGVSIAKGKYILKTDAHCMFAEGFDETLQKDCDGDWVVIPSRYSLDAENWQILHTGKSRVDYHYLTYPLTPDSSLQGAVWNDRARERVNKSEYNIDEEMSFQGSCWFTEKKHFVERCDMFDCDMRHYGTFINEPQELGLKTWLSGGKVMVNKNTWYAHLHKGKVYGRGYSMSKNELVNGQKWSIDFWMNNRWYKQIHDMSWFIEHFWPVPSWPEDRKLWIP